MPVNALTNSFVLGAAAGALNGEQQLLQLLHLLHVLH